MKGFSDKSYAQKLSACALFCSLLILGAYIRIPLAVPVTLQLLFSNTSALLLGKRWGYVPSLLYLLLGIAGLPVFSTGGGLAAFISPSFGFVLGFVPGTAIAGYISSSLRHRAAYAIASIVNSACVYLCGIAYFLMISRLYFGDAYTLSYALSVCVLPFIIPDAVKLMLSIILAKRLEKHI